MNKELRLKEQNLWKKYARDCEELWAKFNRKSNISELPPPEYVRMKDALLKTLEEDIEGLRK